MLTRLWTNGCLELVGGGLGGRKGTFTVAGTLLSCRPGEEMCGWDKHQTRVKLKSMEISGVKGQPSESVKATTVGTDQSQCHSSIDWMHTVTIPSHTPTHAQYSLFVLLAGFCCPSNTEFMCAVICRPVTAVAYLRIRHHRSSGKRVK